MTAGSGILHQEMPKGDAHGRMHGFQLWANLPSSLKMTAPRYQDVTAQTSPRSWMTTARACASSAASSGASEARSNGVAAEPRYLDVSVPPGRRKTLAGGDVAPRLRVRVRGLRNVPRRVAAVGVLTETRGRRHEAVARERTGNRSLVLFDSGDEVTVQAGDEGIRFLLVSGKPLEEPVAWYGPIVMNTQAELQKAMRELRDGSFIKGRA